MTQFAAGRAAVRFLFCCPYAASVCVWWVDRKRVITLVYMGRSKPSHSQFDGTVISLHVSSWKSISWNPCGVCSGFETRMKSHEPLRSITFGSFPRASRTTSSPGAERLFVGKRIHGHVARPAILVMISAALLLSPERFWSFCAPFSTSDDPGIFPPFLDSFQPVQGVLKLLFWEKCEARTLVDLAWRRCLNFARRRKHGFTHGSRRV